jgi:hypothetical protein
LSALPYLFKKSESKQHLAVLISSFFSTLPSKSFFINFAFFSVFQKKRKHKREHKGKQKIKLNTKQEAKKKRNLKRKPKGNGLD